jgi:hypothetical protein
MEKITDENDTRIMVNTTGYRLSGTKYCIGVSLNTVVLRYCLLVSMEI